QEVDSALDEDLKELKISREDFAAKVLSKYGRTLFEWREDVVRTRLLMQKLARVSLKPTAEELRHEFSCRYGPRVLCRVLAWPADQEAQAKRDYEDVQKDIDKAKELARRLIPAPGADVDGVIVVPRYLEADGPDAKRLADMAFLLRPGQLSPLFRFGERWYALQCIGLLPAEEGKDF